MDKKRKSGIYQSMSIAVCMPTHNEDPIVIQSVVARIRAVIGESGHICVYNDEQGRGKGYALRMALRAAEVYNPDYYIFIDGDGDIDPEQRGKIALHLAMGYDIVVGKKKMPTKLDRKILTFASRLWIKLLFGIKVDTQTGLKGFNYKPEWERDGWAFDVEILYNAKKMGKSMKEVPVYAIVSSGKSIRDIMSTLWDTIKIRMGL